MGARSLEVVARPDVLTVLLNILEHVVILRPVVRALIAESEVRGEPVRDLTELVQDLLARVLLVRLVCNCERIARVSSVRVRLRVDDYDRVCLVDNHVVVMVAMTVFVVDILVRIEVSHVASRVVLGLVVI